MIRICNSLTIKSRWPIKNNVGGFHCIGDFCSIDQQGKELSHTWYWVFCLRTYSDSFWEDRHPTIYHIFLIYSFFDGHLEGLPSFLLWNMDVKLALWHGTFFSIKCVHLFIHPLVHLSVYSFIQPANISLHIFCSDLVPQDIVAKVSVATFMTGSWMGLASNYWEVGELIRSY